MCIRDRYIDEGGWEDDELIDLPSEDIFGENSLVSDFEEWYYETYGVPVKVEYSTFGTNEELYSCLLYTSHLHYATSVGKKLRK